VALLIIALIVCCASLFSRLAALRPIKLEKTQVPTIGNPHTLRDDFGLMRTRGTFKPSGYRGSGAAQNQFDISARGTGVYP
jgi:hypothetical protein